ncbi:hypothetical protein I6F30_16205 [Bradyrhizobium sp. NBAIM20]|uniref:hypothetical protein n=1 Tax=unclassified Bradyrhizobium TaxID=2631580 RepID=UPI001CD4DB65|nr:MULTISPECIES: hypothetical protein [unclassified Bradyrhizobium]MCA1412665.1 hypothetical protein [Bradyrhizobium sp. NBAIM20]MCA1463485.1 hypothetical protein [Bradyrhizobium sp. NBAIM18]
MTRSPLGETSKSAGAAVSIFDEAFDEPTNTELSASHGMFIHCGLAQARRPALMAALETRKAR